MKVSINSFVVITILVVVVLIVSINHFIILNNDNFSTAYKNDSNISSRFVIYGDSRDNIDIHASLIRKMNRHHPVFVIHTGDMVNTGIDKEWMEFKNITQHLDSKFYPCIGNHEYNNLSNYFHTFPQYEKYYSFIFDDIKFIVLDTCDLDDEQLKWLRCELNRSYKTVFIIGHHPIYKLRTRDDPINLNKLPSIFNKYHIYAYVSGHEHYYYKTERDNVQYIITGGGGAPLHTSKKYKLQKGDIYIKKHHYLLFEIRENKKINMEVVEL